MWCVGGGEREGGGKRDREEGRERERGGTGLSSSQCGFRLVDGTSRSRSDRAKTVDVEKI